MQRPIARLHRLHLLAPPTLRRLPAIKWREPSRPQDRSLSLDHKTGPSNAQRPPAVYHGLCNDRDLTIRRMKRVSERLSNLIGQHTFVHIKGLRGLSVKSLSKFFSPIKWRASGKYVLNQFEIASGLLSRSRVVFGANKVQVNVLSCSNT